MPGKYDINIGPNQWISWVEPDFAAQSPVSIDELLAPSRPFWDQLEVLCVADCCGIEAFALWPDDVQAAAAAVGLDEVKSQLQQLRAAIRGLDSQIVAVSRLNNLFDRRVFLQLLDHLLACLD